MTVAQLADELGVPEDEAAALADALEALRLVVRTPGRRPTLVVAPPQVAVAALLARAEEDLRRARTGLAELVAAYRFGHRGRQADELIDVVRGNSGIRYCFAQIQRAAKRQILAFVKPPFVLPTGDNTDEFDVLARGVECRAVYERNVLETPGAAEEVGHYIAAGEQARAVDRLPAKFVIADEQVALIPVDAGQPDVVEPGAILVQAEALVEVMVALFEHVWAQATPLNLGPIHETPGSAPRGLALSEDDSRILALLLSGLSDKNVATQLGISLRTVQRRVRHLMDVTGVHTRMQLGWHCARHSWG
jgi:DNA-binding CsgD family transcriptional regulator